MGKTHLQDKDKAAARRLEQIEGFSVCLECEYHFLRDKEYLVPPDEFDDCMSVSSEGAAMISDHIRAKFSIRKPNGKFLLPQGVGVHDEVLKETRCKKSSRAHDLVVCTLAEMFSHRVFNRILRATNPVFIFFLDIAKAVRSEGRVPIVNDGHMIAGINRMDNRVLSFSHMRSLSKVPRHNEEWSLEYSPFGSRVIRCGGLEHSESATMVKWMLHGHTSTVEEQKLIADLFVHDRSFGDSRKFLDFSFQGFLSKGGNTHWESSWSDIAVVEAIGALGNRGATKMIADLVDMGARLTYTEWSRGFLPAYLNHPDMPIDVLVNMHQGSSFQGRNFKKVTVYRRISITSSRGGGAAS